MVYNAIQWINHSPADNCQQNVLYYLRERDLSSGKHYQPIELLGQGLSSVYSQLPPKEEMIRDIILVRTEEIKAGLKNKPLGLS